MMVSSCNCNHHCSLLPSKTLLNLSPQLPRYFPSFEISVVRYWKFPFKSSCRRTLVGTSSATAADSQTLPQSAIQRIAEKLRSLGYVEESITNETTEKTQNSCPSTPSPGEIFVPLRAHLPKHRVGHTLDPSWSTPENPVPEPGSGHAIQKFHELRRGVLKEKEEERLRNNEHGKGQRVPTLAELTVPENELRRLRTIGISLKKKLKVGKSGITEGIVNGIHERWRRSELVKITCEDICRLNMKRTHDLLERKTGGLVIWRSGANIILYRGADYKYPYFFTDNNSSDESSRESPDLNMDNELHGERRICLQNSEAVESPGLNSSKRMAHPPLMQGVGLPNRVRFQLPGEEQLAEEAEKLLEGLGPRFTDWWGYDPQPVDADLLPAIVPGYKRPFRLLPYGVKPKLTNDEMTTLRRLGLPLPCHFALGRNRKLQGLAASIIKLWEKCEIAKIAIKRGVQNTNSELMADELKWLTGGTLLSRDREFISFYRGKDFLPAAVSSAVQGRRQYRTVASEKRTGSMRIMNPEEHNHGIEEHSPEFEHKTMTDSMLIMNPKEQKHGTEEHLPEFELNEKRDQKLQGRSELRKLRFSDEAIEKASAKMSMALAKKARAEKLIAELEKQETPQPPEMDKEGITEEERYMLRKVGLRMKPFLLLGRRGVFDGTVENMHLHWKYRELIKVLVSSRKIEEVHGIARTLESESGGILVAVERVSKGYAIIIYRGKNYKRPASLRPQTLLSKRGALKRSLEAQRCQSLKLHVLKLTRNIDELKLKLGRDKDTNGVPLDKDLKLEFDKEQEIGEINVNKDEVIDIDHKTDYQSYFGYPVNEKVRECDGTDATSEKPDDFLHSSVSSVHIAQQDIPGGILLQPDIDGKDASGIPKEKFQPRSLLNETPGSSNINEQRESIDTSPCKESQDPVNALAITCSQTHFPDATVDYSTAKLESSVEKAIQKGSSVYRAPQLSNRERLVLRKQALRMKNLPVLAIGKRNIVMGVAKAIKAHFKKHSLAIVNIKGRAKGTSIQEVIFNLERATGSVLVSQEPSKVILYKQLEAGDGRAQRYGKGNEGLQNEYLSGERKTRQLVSPELISAIRLECGLKSANKEASNVTADGSIEKPNLPNDD